VAVAPVGVPAMPATVPMPAMVKFTLPVGGLDPEVACTVAVNVTLSP